MVKNKTKRNKSTMLSLQRSNHPTSLMPWYSPPTVNDTNTANPVPNFWLKMSSQVSPAQPEESSSSSSSSGTASTTVPPPLASSSSVGSQINSFYPSQEEIKRKQTRATLRSVNIYQEPNLPLGKFLSPLGS